MLNQRLQVSDRTNLTQPGSTTLANLGEKAFGTLQAGSGSIRTSGGDISLDKLLLNSFQEVLPGSINLSKKPTILTIDFNPLQLRRHGTQLSVDITSDSGTITVDRIGELTTFGEVSTFRPFAYLDT